MPRLLLRASCAALLTAMPAWALAAEDEDTVVAEVVATGTRDIAGVDADKVGGSLTVITAGQFQDPGGV